MQPAALPVGTCVGPYIIGDRLGAGAMGEVYAARDSRLARRVALKRLWPDERPDAQRHEQILREARTAARITHPNVAAVHDVFEEASGTFIVMEFVDGQNLAEHLRDHRLPPERIAAIGRQLADGLAAAHEQGVIHRDLKPANIQLTSSGVAKILDFGVARATHSILPTGATSTLETSGDEVSGGRPVGTPAYMSPEQSDGRPVDERSDVYSLGIILAEMATGRRLSHNRAGAPDTARELREATHSSSLATVISTALQIDPGARYASARALSAALASVEQRRAPRWTAVAVTIAAVVIAGALASNWFGGQREPTEPRALWVRSVAVLPLVNLSQRADQDYFSDGMTEGIINTLGQIGALKVTARTSVMAFKGTKKTIPEIAAELGVDAILEGSATLEAADQGPERVRVSVNLIDPKTQTAVWTATLVRNLDGVIQIQAEIAQTIAGKFDLSMTTDEQTSLATRPTVDPEAYKLYLLGRQAFGLRGAENVRNAVSLFSQSIGAAPTYAPAHAALAEAFAWLIGEGELPREEGTRQTLASAQRALDYDQRSAEAHTAMGWAQFYLVWDWPKAEDHFKQALHYNPSLAATHHRYGNFLSDMGREDDALDHMRLAATLDQGQAIYRRDVAWPLFFSERYADAERHLTALLADHPGYLQAERLLARTQVQMQKFTEAIARYRAIVDREDSPRERFELAWAYAVAGRRQDADAELRRALAKPEARRHPYDLALVLCALARTDEAVNALERAYDEKDSTIVNLKHDVRLKSLRDHKRFRQVLAKMRFPD